MSGSESHALVLSGGGAYAAYEIGVLKALFTGASPATSHRPIAPRIVTGTSAGAFNGALLVSRWQMEPADAVAAMERVWLDEVAGGPGRCGNGVFRWRGSPLNLLDLKCLTADPGRYFVDRMEDGLFFARSMLERSVAFAQMDDPLERRFLELLNFSNLISTDPFPGLIRRTVNFAAVGASPMVLQIVATNWRTGEARVFAKEHLDAEAGPPIIMASSAIPGIFPPVPIPPDVFVDGGVLMNTPLAPAIHSGATHLHVLYLDPDVRHIPLQELATTFNTVQRAFAISMAATLNRDIANAASINRGLALLEGLRAGGTPMAGEARAFMPVAERLLGQLAAGEPLRPLVIHRYHPRDLLGGPLGVLSFEREMTEELIERGWRDAVNHDCAASGCVTAEGATTGS